MRNYGQSVMLKPLGSPNERTPVIITGDAVSPTEIAINSGKNHLEIYNRGNDNIYFGGSSVTSAKGVVVSGDNSHKCFNNCEDDFKVYLKCAAGEQATVRIVEYA